MNFTAVVTSAESCICSLKYLSVVAVEHVVKVNYTTGVLPGAMTYFRGWIRYSCLFKLYLYFMWRCSVMFAGPALRHFCVVSIVITAIIIINFSNTKRIIVITRLYTNQYYLSPFLLLFVTSLLLVDSEATEISFDVGTNVDLSTSPKRLSLVTFIIRSALLVSVLI